MPALVALDERGMPTRAGRELRSFVGVPYPDAVE
jgi:hypothetical protein